MDRRGSSRRGQPDSALSAGSGRPRRSRRKGVRHVTRIVSSFAALTLLVVGLSQRPLAAADMSAGQRAIADAARQNQHTFVMFYRGDDPATQSMHRTVQSTLAERTDAVVLPVRLDDAA